MTLEEQITNKVNDYIKDYCNEDTKKMKRYIVRLTQGSEYDYDYDVMEDWISAYNIKDVKAKIKNLYGKDWKIDYIAEIKYERKD